MTREEREELYDRFFIESHWVGEGSIYGSDTVISLDMAMRIIDEMVDETTDN